VGSYGNVIDLIRVSYLDLDPFAERRDQLCEDDLLIPDRFITALLDRCFSLETQRRRRRRKLNLQSKKIQIHL